MLLADDNARLIAAEAQHITYFVQLVEKHKTYRNITTAIIRRMRPQSHRVQTRTRRRRIQNITSYDVVGPPGYF